MMTKKAKLSVLVKTLELIKWLEERSKWWREEANRLVVAEWANRGSKDDVLTTDAKRQELEALYENAMRHAAVLGDEAERLKKELAPDCSRSEDAQ